MGRHKIRMDFLEPDVAARIKKHFRGNIKLAFNTLRPDIVHWTKKVDVDDDVPVSLSSFYRMMRGELCSEDQIQTVLVTWSLLDKLRVLPPLTANRLSIKEFMIKEFGSIRKAQEALFPEWHYPTLAGLLNGYGKQCRLSTLFEILSEYRQKEIAQEEDRRKRLLEEIEAQRRREEAEQVEVEKRLRKFAEECRARARAFGLRSD